MARKETVKVKKKKVEANEKDAQHSSQQVGKDTLNRLRFAQQCLLYRTYYTTMGKEEWWWIMDDVQELIANQLNDQGYVVLDGLLTDKHAANLKAEVVACHEAGHLETAGLVNGKLPEGSDATYVDTYTRGDLIGWFDPGDKAWTFGGHLDSYLVRLGTLISELGSDAEHPRLVPDLGRVTSRSKAMIACYPGGGARYVKHVDNDGKHPLCKTRLLTALMYLNESWKPGDGGELAIFSSDDDTELRDVVEPLSNRLLIFWSDWRTPHEVLAASKARYAVTLWVLDNTCNGTQEGKQVIPKQATLEALAEGEKGSKAIVYGKTEVTESTEAPTTGDAEVLGEAPDSAELPGEDEATTVAAIPPLFERDNLSYRWLSKDESWELQVDVSAGEASSSSCPIVDLSEALVQLSGPSPSSSSSSSSSFASSPEPGPKLESGPESELEGQLKVLLRIPLPSLGPGALASSTSSTSLTSSSSSSSSWLAGAPRWSRKRGRLTIEMAPAPSLASPTMDAVDLAESRRLSASERLAEQLSARSWGYVDGFLGGPEADELRELFFTKAGNSSGPRRVPHSSFQLEKEVEEGRFPRSIELLCERSRGLFELVSGHASGASSLSVQVSGSLYAEGGTFPLKNLDQKASTKSSENKKPRLLLICFLNPFWRPEDGGELRLFDDMVEPLHGRAVAYFGQDCFDHEVTTSLGVGAAALVGVYQ